LLEKGKRKGKGSQKAMVARLARWERKQNREKAL
jgi:hypothetical protein